MLVGRSFSHLRVLVTATAVALVASLAGCGDSEGDADEGPDVGSGGMTSSAGQGPGPGEGGVGSGGSAGGGFAGFAGLPDLPEGAEECLECVTSTCPEAQECFNDPACVQGALCAFTTCVSDQDAPAGLDCWLGCFEGNSGAALAAFTAFTCVGQNCGMGCAGLAGP